MSLVMTKPGLSVFHQDLQKSDYGLRRWQILKISDLERRGIVLSMKRKQRR